MSNPVAPRRWFQNWRASPPPAVHDPADFGTAFGLDLSLNELVPRPDAPATPPRHTSGWVSRLAARRKPAA